MEVFDDEVVSVLLETAGPSGQEQETGPSTPAGQAGRLEAAGPQFPAGPGTTSEQSHSVEEVRTSTPKAQSRRSSRTSGDRDPHHDSRSRQRTGDTTPAGANGEIVMSLQDIGESVGVIEDSDQLFCNAIAAELRKQPEDAKRKMKGDICRVVYG